MIQSSLLENNLQIYNELLQLTCHDNNIKFEKDISKNYFTIFVNNKYYAILSDFYNNNIKLDIIGEDLEKYVTILETLETSYEIFNYFYNINYNHSPEKIKYVINKKHKYKRYYNKNNKYYNNKK
jgi:hypothetical protein